MLFVFEYINCRNGSHLSLQGTMDHRAIIGATTDIFDDTRVKMKEATAEKESVR